ncbi:A disintegrin and metallo ase with thrombospondin motifs 3, partial [Paramuricea clavata]
KEQFRTDRTIQPNHRNVEKIMTNLRCNQINCLLYLSLARKAINVKSCVLCVICGGSNMNAAKAWYKEVWDYNYCHNERNFNRPGHAGKATGHFTQVVWKTSTKLGIGFARSADKKTVYVVGRYLAHGNVGGLYGKNVLKANYLFHTFQNNCNGKNGRFSAWSKPGECSQSCGGGIRFKTRTCTNPKPSLNGGDCYGTTSQLAAQQWCNTQSCPEGDKSHRVQQCQARGLLAKSYTFNNNQCGLFCHSGSGNIYTGAGKVDDGTHCNSDSGVCMDGQCKTMPKYESSKSEQNTGAEEGEISGSYTDIPNANIWKNLILTVPNGAINVDITNYFYEDASICVGYKKSHGGMGYSFCENSWMNDHVAYYGEYKKTKTIAGVTFTYNRNKDYSEIYIDGPVHSTPGYSFVLFVKGSSEADIEWTYDV